MEALKSFIVNNWSTIIEYAFLAVVYFLVFLYKNKVMNVKDAINLAFNQFSTKFADNEASNKSILEACLTDSAKTLQECKEKYEAAVNEIADYKEHITNLEKVVTMLLSDDLDLYIEDELNLGGDKENV
jgi:hypothetical protein